MAGFLDLGASVAATGGSAGTGVFNIQYQPNFGEIEGAYDPSNVFTPYTVNTPTSSETKDGGQSTATPNVNLPAPPAAGGYVTASNATTNSETTILILGAAAVGLFLYMRKHRK